jgi:hypothetical protein
VAETLNVGDDPVVPTTSSRRSALSRPAHAADVAQAELFIRALQREAEELAELIALAEARWSRLCERSASEFRRPPDALVRFRERLAEVQKLQENLRTRFLQL